MMIKRLVTILTAIALLQALGCGMGQDSGGGLLGGGGGFFNADGTPKKEEPKEEPKEEEENPAEKPKELTDTDQLLAGQWVAEQLNNDGDRIVITLTPGTGERKVAMTAIHQAGDAEVVASGVYEIDGSKLIFKLTNFSQVSSTFTVSDRILTLGTEIFYKVDATFTGGTVGGQIRLSPETANDMVKAKTQSLPNSNLSALTGEVLVKYKNGDLARVVVQPDASQLQALSVNGDTGTGLVALGFRQVALKKARVEKASEMIEKLRKDPSVEYVVHNRYVKSTSDPISKDPLSNSDDQWNLRLLDMVDAWGAVKSSRESIVAIIDTGLAKTVHPDLAGRVKYGFDFVSKAIKDIPLSLDGDGADNDFTDPGWVGSPFHGTHLAGIVAAIKDNDVGMAGAGTNNVKLMILRAIGDLGDGGSNGTLYDVAQAIFYAARLPNVADCKDGMTTAPDSAGQTVYKIDESKCVKITDDIRPRADVINLSLGSFMSEADAKPMTEAIYRATREGVLVVASSGNKSSSAPFYPAADPNVLAVGAITANLTFARTYSNFGYHKVVAPGGSKTAGVLGTGANADYHELVGTSQAAAHVSAIAAMVKAENSNLRPGEIVQILQDTAVDLGEKGKDLYYGYGMINACAALLKARMEAPIEKDAFNLSTTSLDFGKISTVGTVIANACGPIPWLKPTASTQDGGGWLSVRLIPGATYARLDVSVNRDGMKPGHYEGTISLGSKSIGVVLTVPEEESDGSLDGILEQIGKFTPGEPEFQNELDIGTVVVFLQNASEPCRGPADPKPNCFYVTTSFESNYFFQLNGIPAGSYYMVGGIDDNGDGNICIDGETEFCAMYPSAESPRAVTIQAGQRINDLVWTF